MNALYHFAVTLRIEAGPEDSWVDPASFETMFYTAAAEPDQDGWTLFRDHLWRGEVADEGHMRVLVEDALGVPVERVEFRALETDQDYVDALREAIADDLEAFRAETVDEVLSKYIGSAIEVRDAEAF